MTGLNVVLNHCIVHDDSTLIHMDTLICHIDKGDKGVDFDILFQINQIEFAKTISVTLVTILKESYNLEDQIINFTTHITTNN